MVGWILVSFEVLREVLALQGRAGRPRDETFESLLHVHVRVRALWFGCLFVWCYRTIRFVDFTITTLRPIFIIHLKLAMAC